MKILMTEAPVDRKEFIERAYNNDTYKKMKAICDKYGYELGLAYWANYGDAVINIKPSNVSKYIPVVYPPQIYVGKDEPWRVMTTSYGSLSIDEFAKFVADNKRAYDMIEELSKIDLTTLEHEPLAK